jgi:hypothetical protein
MRPAPVVAGCIECSRFSALGVIMRQRVANDFAAITVLGFALFSGNAAAQQRTLKEQLVGTWIINRCEVVQPDGTKGRWCLVTTR